MKWLLRTDIYYIACDISAGLCRQLFFLNVVARCGCMVWLHGVVSGNQVNSKIGEFVSGHEPTNLVYVVPYVYVVSALRVCSALHVCSALGCKNVQTMSLHLNQWLMIFQF